MAYIKYKEITKYFYFSRIVEIKKCPKYVKDYIFEDETLLSLYKTSSDHGAFTDRKMVLFDLGSTFGIAKQIYTIPYSSVSSISIVFKSSKANLVMMLDSGYPLVLKFINMDSVDKLRLRLIYSCITQRMDHREPSKDVIRRLIEDDMSLGKGVD